MTTSAERQKASRARRRVLETVTFQIHLPKAQHLRLKKAAARKKMKLSAYILGLLK